MNIEDMNLTQVIERLAALDEEVRSADNVQKVDELTAEKKTLLERKAALDALETRKQTALDITAGKITGKKIEERKMDPAVVMDKETATSTPEYRKAFKDYIQRGVEIPIEYRIDAFTATTDAAAVIPSSIVNEVIRTLKQYGNLYERVRKLNIKGGVKVPISSVAPTATWVTESAVSDRKKVDMSTSVTFAYYGLECKIASSLLAEATTLDIFETTIVDLITEAMMKALDIGIVAGDGSGEMTGITATASGVTAITLTPSEFINWDAWKKKVFAKLGIRYKAGAAFIMANGTFEGYVDGMTDANGQPIGRINYGITNGAQERFGGKEVILVEDDVIANYNDASTGDVVAVFGDLNKYAINTNMSMTMYRYLDHDTNQWIDKAILIADGKVLDANAFVIVKKGA